MSLLPTRHLLGIEGLDKGHLEALLSSAERHLQMRKTADLAMPLSRKVIANVFFEDSTRTRSSFEIAAKELGAEVLNWTTKGTSVSKGETLLDTVRNIDAMGIYAMVIRHGSSGAPLLVSRHVRCAVVNAGDGTHEHPSQALLDAFTLQKRLGPLAGKHVGIVGDVLHSRVARSNILCLATLGAKVSVCGPPTLVPKELARLQCELSHSLDALLPKLDAVMMLRVQLERQTDAHFPSAREFSRLFGLSPERARKLPEHAVVLHPGPINRGVEISSEVADGPKSVILEQVAHGVAVRRAILEALA